LRWVFREFLGDIFCICRNPSLQKMFMYLGGGERAGSGADTILRGWTDNQWCRPSIIENHTNDLVCLTLQTESLFAMAHAENECRRSGMIPQEKVATPQEKESIPQEKRPTPQEKGKSTPQEKESTPQEKVATPQEKVATPQEKVATPQEKEAAPQEKEFTPQEKVAAPQEKGKFTPQEKVATPQEKEFTPQEKRPTPQEKVAAPQEKSKSTPQEKGNVTVIPKQNVIEKLILDFCVEPKNTAEIAELLGIKDKKFVRKKYLAPLIGISLELTHPDVPRHRNQKYRTKRP